MKPKKYICHTFRQEIWYFIGWKQDKFEAYLVKHIGSVPNLGMRCGGTCLHYESENDSLIVIWVYDKRRFDIVSHEALHAANYILDMIGHKPSHRNDEVQAYLSQEILREAYT